RVLFRSRVAWDAMMRSARATPRVLARATITGATTRNPPTSRSPCSTRAQTVPTWLAVVSANRLFARCACSTAGHQGRHRLGALGHERLGGEISFDLFDLRGGELPDGAERLPAGQTTGHGLSGGVGPF